MSIENQDDDQTFETNTNADENDKTVTTSGKALPSSITNAIPTEIGGYRIIGLLGEGGMGVVYEAEQPSPRRRVALKVIRGVQLVDDLRLKMFQREAETLARLDHPNIGAIYESGRTAEGQHFFAMELVRGQTLGDWLANRPKNPDSKEINLRLELFCQICNAVHYAHQRGVIHRDLKPSNLIVTDSPIVSSESNLSSGPMAKILDFGLARITEEDVAFTQVTEIGVIKGTLPYMAPEQASGQVDDIDVRTDVYALGVILYELMTCERPYSTDTGSLLSAVKVICEQKPAPLAQKWKSSVRLDMDLVTIINMALDKDPDRRYSSAAAFAEDIIRLLTSQPILARPASTMYQMRKLISRQKTLFTTIAASIVLLLVSAVGIGILYIQSEANLTRALEAEKTALLEAKTTERTSDFLVGLFRQANPERTRGETITAREIMDEGARTVRTELKNEPVMQARLMSSIAEVYFSLGLYNEARELIDEALELRRIHLPKRDIAQGESLSQLAKIIQYQGDPQAARQVFDSAISFFEVMGPPGQEKLIGILSNYGSMLGDLGEAQEGLQVVNRALTLLESNESQDQLISALINKSAIFLDMRQSDSALAALEDALDLSRSSDGKLNVQTAHILTNLSIVSARTGKIEQSYKYSQEALEIFKAVYGDNHPMTAKANANVSISLAQMGKPEEGIPYLEQSIEILKKIYGTEHPEIAQGYSNIGLMKLESGDAKAAVKDLKQASRMFEKLTGPTTPSMSYALYHLATAHASLKEYEESRKLLMRVVAIDEKLYGMESQEIADDLEDVVMVLRELNRKDEANKYETRMQSIRTKLSSADSEIPAN